MNKFTKPNYKNNLVNFSSSLMKYYGQTSNYPTHGVVDFILSKKYRHVAVIVLDGLGTSIIEKNLNNGSIFKTHQIIKLNSVFPPTTVAATTAIRTGKAPIESGWLGWSLYLNDEDPSVELFSNNEHYTQTPFTKFKTGEVIDNTPFFKKLKKAESYEIMPAFVENGVKTFAEGVDKLLNIVNKDEANFTYFYWTNPDGLMHEHGTSAPIVKVNILELEEQIEKLKENLPDNTCIFITADHGQLDVEPIELYNNTNITRCYRKLPSGEGRATQFYIEDEFKDEFENTFKELYGEYFNLYTKEEFIKSQLAGMFDPHENTKYSLGDYISIATDKYYFQFAEDKDGFVFKGHHAGLTDDEVFVPLILLKRKDEVVEE